MDDACLLDIDVMAIPHNSDGADARLDFSSV